MDMILQKMSAHAAHHTGKSPYQRSNSARRSRGSLLVLTVVVLLIAVGAWLVSYTKSLQVVQPMGVQSIDPAVNVR